MPSKICGGPAILPGTVERSMQLCEQDPALQAATNQHRHTEGSSVEKLTRPDTYHEPLPMRGGKG